jgi:hypothetical protein
VFAYQKRQQAGLFLKDLVPLTAIGSAYAISQRSEVRGQRPSAASGEASSGLVQSSAGVRLAGIHNGTGRGQRASAFAQGYGATRRSKGQRAGVEMTIRAGLALNDELMLMIDHRSQRFEVRSRTREPFRIAQLDLAKVWRPGGKKYQTRGSQPAKTGQFLRR